MNNEVAGVCRRRGVGDGICFFFSSRRRHTRFDCDWSSDVCSSDLTTMTVVSFMVKTEGLGMSLDAAGHIQRAKAGTELLAALYWIILYFSAMTRSEERRVGKECRSRWSPYH